MHIFILLDFCEWDISMVWCKTAVTTVRQQWSYCSLALSHRYIDHRRIPPQKASNVELRVFLLAWTSCKTVELLFVSDAMTHLWRHCNGVIVASIMGKITARYHNKSATCLTNNFRNQWNSYAIQLLYGFNYISVTHIFLGWRLPGRFLPFSHCPVCFKNTKMLVTYCVHSWNVLPQNSYLG